MDIQSHVVPVHAQGDSGATAENAGLTWLWPCQAPHTLLMGLHVVWPLCNADYSIW